MSVLDQINNDFQEAFKTRQKNAVGTLRLVLANLKNERIKKKDDLTDEDVIKSLRSEIKKRHESIADYEKGGRQDLAQKEQEEITIIERYLPAQMNEEQVRQKVKELLGVMEDKSNIGKVIGLIMSELKGQADGSMVRKIVEAELQPKS